MPEKGGEPGVIAAERNKLVLRKGQQGEGFLGD